MSGSTVILKHNEKAFESYERKLKEQKEEGMGYYSEVRKEAYEAGYKKASEEAYEAAYKTVSEEFEEWMERVENELKRIMDAGRHQMPIEEALSLLETAKGSKVKA